MRDRGIARHGYPVLAGEDAEPPATPTSPIGTVTSGTMSPTLGTAIAMAYVAAAPGGTRYDAGRGDPRARRWPAEVVPLPFYKRPA